MTDYYENDTLGSLYNELRPLEVEIEATGKRIRELSEQAVRGRAEYELLKNTELIQMFSYEAEKSIKRTEAQRTAIYRAKYSDARLAANLAEHQLKAERDYLNALQSKLMSIQTRARLLETERRINPLTQT